MHVHVSVSDVEIYGIVLGVGGESDQDPRGPHLHATYTLVVCTDA